MSDAPAMPQQPSQHDQMMFWGCFIALITTSFAFVGRLFLLNTWAAEFKLDPAEAGRLAGIGIWPFAVSIIMFSLFIDRIGYKTAMFFAFFGHLIWTVMAVAAYFVKETDPQMGFQLLYWGSLIVALANGTVESFINPVVATMFSKEKTKWLNILHAGWPAGLVVMGILFIGIDAAYGEAVAPWFIKVGLIGIPTVIYFVMLVGLKFPQSERVTAGVSYREMLQEFGIGGAAIVAFLLVLQLMDFFGGAIETNPSLRFVFVGIGVVMVLGFGLYTQTAGRGLLLFLVLVMMPLATTEIGTDGWITGIMESIAETEGFHAGWILVYTSAIMLILRFLAGPIVHTLSPLGLLAVSAVLAALGLAYLSTAAGMAIFVAATLYGFGKTFFWPTMLGVVSEQCPKGGALTLNAISGIGMLAVGTLGMPYIGTLQSKKQIEAVVVSDEGKKVDGLIEDGKLTTIEDKSIYEILSYQVISDKKLKEHLVSELPGDAEELAKIKKERKEKNDPVKDDEVVVAGKQKETFEALGKVRSKSTQGALRDMAVFPIFMLVCYIGLLIYFRSRGGYSAEVLTGHAADDDTFTGGVAGAVE